MPCLFFYLHFTTPTPIYQHKDRDKRERGKGVADQTVTDATPATVLDLPRDTTTERGRQTASQGRGVFLNPRPVRPPEGEREGKSGSDGVCS